MNTESHKVLVIDDDVDCGDLITLILSRAGDDVQTTTSALQALAIAEQYQPDLVILDLSLPDAIDFQDYEYGICHRFKTSPSLQNIPVLLMEATSPELVYPDAKSFGASGYLVKPFGPLELLAAREALLRGEMYYPLDNPTKAEEQMREAEILVRHIKELAHRA
jgi:DNA-binding response OmpR family regulator